jgi:hypothetical protein
MDEEGERRERFEQRLIAFASLSNSRPQIINDWLA